MLYADGGNWISHVRSRTKGALRQAYRSGGRDEHAKEDHSSASEGFGPSSARRGIMPAVRPRRHRRAS
jgi:hypothetical protein